jgi:hypothetical protein
MGSGHLLYTFTEAYAGDYEVRTSFSEGKIYELLDQSVIDKCAYLLWQNV